MSDDRLELVVGDDDAGIRLDVWLAGRLPDISRTRIQALIKDGAVSCVDGGSVTARRKTTAGLRVRVRLPPPQDVELMPENIPLDVIYEDDAIIVVNKPAGLVVHPAPGHPSGTLVNALLYHCDDLGGVGGELRPGIVHRLDRDTSGVMVAAKHQAAMDALSAQFSNRAVAKTYLTITHGIPHPGLGRIETEIGRSSHDRKKMSVNPSSGGRHAVTNYRIVEVLGDFALLEVKIETGRTHQIRVHMAHIGHYIIGDGVYGRRRGKVLLPAPAQRQMLHAYELSLEHPVDGRRMVFCAPLPDDMQAMLEALRRMVA